MTSVSPLRTVFGAVQHFSGGWGYETIYHKGKSDFVYRGLSDDGVSALLEQLLRAAPSKVIAICDPYGGAIADVAENASAFPHRASAAYCIQYYSQWNSARETPNRIKLSRDFYHAMRPYVPGFAYVNYCDRDLPNWGQTYWGPNLTRLRQVKKTYDSLDVFRHAQSVAPP